MTGINMDGNDGPSGGNSGKSAKAGNPQRLAIEAWSASFVPEIDYNATGWRYHFRSRSTTDYFYHYAKKLSETFKTQSAEVNFVMVGACDGVTDPLIKFHFLKQSHWRAVFVEPISINVRDLRQFIDENQASDRSHIIRAAATSVCETPTVDMERPLYEEKASAQNKTVPHWLRRQIGSILPKHRDHARPEWIVETVDCKTAPDILRDWAKAVPVVLPSGKATKSVKRRPHILKIDVEGHDYQVLTGFVNAKTPINELPLLICFEAKSIAEKFPALKEVLEQK
jgi:FkbM family methyltransferase